MAMFIRVKRKKTTYFLHCDPTETILEIKQKIQALSDNPVDCQRLILLGSQLVLEDNKTLADQKGVQIKEPEDSDTPAKDNIVEGLQGVLLEDAKTLSEQQVENDAIVALCLKISDPRVHRIPTLMRPPYTPPTPPTPSPPPTPPEVEEVTLAPGEEPPPPPPPPPPEHRLSTELRVPYRPPIMENDSELGEKQSSQGGISSKKDGSQKKNVRKETQKDEGKKESSKKDQNKKETVKKETNKKEPAKKGGEKKQGKDLPGKGGKETSKKDPGKGGKETSKKGGKKTKEEILPPAEEVVEPPEEGVWEDIIIDKLADYATVEEAD